MKRIFAVTFTLTVLFSANISRADTLSLAFDKMHQKATSFKTKNQMGVSFGSFTARAPVESFQLVSFTPPSFSAGCGGISAYFGGFSAVNGEKLQQLVRNLGQNAKGVVIYLALGVACETCRSVISKMNEWAKLAASGALNSCDLAKNIVGSIAKATDLCKGLSAVNIGDEDAAEGQDNCNSEIESWGKYWDIKSDDDEGKSKKPEEIEFDCGPGFDGNRRWCLIAKSGLIPLVDKNTLEQPDPGVSDAILEQIAIAELIYNMLQYADPTSNPELKAIQGSEKMLTDQVSAIELVYFSALCGFEEPTSEIKELLADRCGKIWETESGDRPEITTCKTDVSDKMVWSRCKKKETLEWDEWANARKTFQGGILVKIVEKLNGVFSKAKQGEEFDKEDIQLINSIPLPIYKLLSLSYSYPQISSQVLEPASLIISNILIQEYFKNALVRTNRISSSEALGIKEIGLITDAVEKFSLIAKKDLSGHSSSQSANLRAYRSSLEADIRVFQQMMFDDIASQHMGKNLSSQVSINTIINASKPDKAAK